MVEEFPCRTKTLSGTSFRIEMYRVSDGVRSGSTSVESEKEKDSFIKAMEDSSPNKYTFKVTPYLWSEEVCIECGQRQ
jgi:hypothetical protein